MSLEHLKSEHGMSDFVYETIEHLVDVEADVLCKAVEDDSIKDFHEIFKDSFERMIVDVYEGGRHDALMKIWKERSRRNEE